MRYKATFVVGFAAGYVLGAKAGRQRYEQLMGQWRTLTGKPEVREAAETVKHAVTDRLVGKDVTDQVHDLTIRV